MKRFSQFRQELNEAYYKTAEQKKKYDDVFDRYKHPYSLKNIANRIKRYKDEFVDMIKNPNSKEYEPPVVKASRKNATDAFDKKLQQKDQKNELTK